VALRKLFEWNLWTGEMRERRRELLLYKPYLRNMRVLAGVARCRMVWEASMLRAKDISRDPIKGDNDEKN
jgi:hypothetical protein